MRASRPTLVKPSDPLFQPCNGVAQVRDRFAERIELGAPREELLLVGEIVAERSEQAARNRVEREATRVERPHDEVADSVVAVDETQFERRRVRRALDRLTSMQREAVELAYFGGHTYREVAVLLGVPEGTIKTRIRDGMIRLRDELGAPA